MAAEPDYAASASLPFSRRVGHAVVTLVAYLLPPVACMVGIFLMGSDTGSAEHSRGWLAAFLEALGVGPSWSPVLVEGANVALRKLGHLLTYAFLALLLARLGRRLGGAGAPGSPEAVPPPGLPARYALAAWLGAVAQAAADEFHQSFFPSRGASAWDVALDGLGAAAGILLYRTWIVRRQRKEC